MARRPAKQKIRKDVIPLDESIREFLFYGTAEKGTTGWELETSKFFDQGRAITEAWEAHKPALMGEWIKKHPGTRPLSWWEYDAPREPVPGWNHKRFDSAQRRRLGGTGTPSHEALSIAPHFSRGIPKSWIHQPQPEDPPIYESEAEYLRRHDLLTAEEKRALASMPEAWEPEKVEINGDL